MRNIGTYIKVVDADEHRIIEELRSLREKERKDAHDITAAKAKSIRIREGYARANELRNNKPIEEALIPEVLCSLIPYYMYMYIMYKGLLELTLLQWACYSSIRLLWRIPREF